MSLYSFPAEIAIDPGVRHSVTCLFCYRGNHLTELFRETFERITNVALPPSRIILACPDGLQTAIRNAFNALQEQISDRLRVTSHVLLVPYGIDGTIAENQELLRGVDSWHLEDHEFLALALFGVKQLVHDTNVILQAPAGYQYRKPSGDKSSIFVRTGNMLREPHCLGVFVPLLLRRVPSDIRKIYIDSSTILPFAMELQRALSYFSLATASGGSNDSLIVNFQSYLDIENLSIDRSESYIIVISASTSGNLARKMLQKCNALSDRVVHLVGAGSESSDQWFRDSCIFFRRMDLSGTPSAGTRDIHIVGEEFIISPSDSTAVRISKAHINYTVSGKLLDSFYRDSLKFFVRGSDSGYSRYSPVVIHNANQLGSDALKRWIRHEVMYSVPASVQLIVYVDSPNSRSHRLACHVEQIIVELRGQSGRSTTVWSIAELESANSLSSLSADATVLVVASEDPGLQGFRRASRSLRTSPGRYIHYLVCHSFPETIRGYERVKSDLRQGGLRGKHGWSQFTLLPIGSSEIHDSWWVEKRELISVEKLDLVKDWRGLGNLRAKLDARARWLSGDTSLEAGQFFLPTIRGEDMELQPDSVFFDSGYGVGEVSQEVVYLMVASALQYAREGTSCVGRRLEDGLRFDDNPFVRSVIDPRMFSRFSDGVLQAAFLRALSHYELNYTRNSEMSSQLCDIICSLLDMADTQVGEASLEFMAALYSKKISLIPRDQEKIGKKIMESADLRVVWRLFGSSSPI